MKAIDDMQKRALSRLEKTLSDSSESEEDTDPESEVGGSAAAEQQTTGTSVTIANLSDVQP